MIAKIRNSDLKGTISLRFDDSFLILRNLLEERSIDVKRYEPIGIRINLQYNSQFYFEVLCIDKSEKNELGQIKSIAIKDWNSIDIFFEFVKDLEIIATTSGFSERDDWTINSKLD